MSKSDGMGTGSNVGHIGIENKVPASIRRIIERGVDGDRTNREECSRCIEVSREGDGRRVGGRPSDLRGECPRQVGDIQWIIGHDFDGALANTSIRKETEGRIGGHETGTKRVTISVITHSIPLAVNRGVSEGEEDCSLYQVSSSEKDT